MSVMRRITFVYWSFGMHALSHLPTRRPLKKISVAVSTYSLSVSPSSLTAGQRVDTMMPPRGFRRIDRRDQAHMHRVPLQSLSLPSLLVDLDALLQPGRHRLESGGRYWFSYRTKCLQIRTLTDALGRAGQASLDLWLRRWRVQAPSVPLVYR